MLLQRQASGEGYRARRHTCRAEYAWQHCSGAHIADFADGGVKHGLGLLLLLRPLLLQGLLRLR
jgi:hypothetical protein